LRVVRAIKTISGGAGARARACPEKLHDTGYFVNVAPLQVVEEMLWIYPVAAGIRTSPFVAQLTCSTRPTTKTHASPPTTNTPAVIVNGVAKLPVRSTANPVRAGAITPAKFAKPFCNPVHRPAACGPASVWVNAKIPELAIPDPNPAAMSHDRYV